MSDGEMILVAGAVLTLSIAAALLADRLRVPGLLLFLGFGMVVGSDVLGWIDFDDAELARTIGVIAVSLILFEGGLTTGWPALRPVFAPALSLALVGTALTAVVAGFAASWIFDLSTLEGMLVGATVAATDGAAIFALLRRSTLERRLAVTLEGESGMNDAVALLLVVGFIDWIDDPGYGLMNMIAGLVVSLGVGAVAGLAAGGVAAWALRRVRFATPGLYPVATIATAALAYGAADSIGGSGFLAVYLAALVLASSGMPARRTVTAFHGGLAWVGQIAVFFTLGLLVFPSKLDEVALEGIVLAGVLMFVARPLATLVATAVGGFSLRERVLLGWAGLRGAVPIVLATFPVIEGLPQGDLFFNIAFFVVVTSTLVQGATFEPLARALRLTTEQPALPEPLTEVGTVRRLGAEVVEFPVTADMAIAGRMVKELDLPREALVSVIVRRGEAIPPRGSMALEAGDRLHILVRQEVRVAVEGLWERWREGPIGEPARPILPQPARRSVLTSRPWRAQDGDPAHPVEVAGVPVAAVLRTRRDRPGALVALADGRFAVTGRSLIVGPPRALRRHIRSRVDVRTISNQELAWWQEVSGVLDNPPRRFAPAG